MIITDKGTRLEDISKGMILSIASRRERVTQIYPNLGRLYTERRVMNRDADAEEFPEILQRVLYIGALISNKSQGRVYDSKKMEQLQLILRT